MVCVWLGRGLASASLYYTAPYRFLVSMFCAPVLIHWLGLGLGWACLFPINSATYLVLIGLSWTIILLFNNCLPHTREPKGFLIQGWPLSSFNSLLSLFVWSLSCLSAFDSFWILIFGSFYCLHVYLVV